MTQFHGSKDIPLRERSLARYIFKRATRALVSGIRSGFFGMGGPGAPFDCHKWENTFL